MYSKIKHPTTGNVISVFSLDGKKIIQKYINFLKGGEGDRYPSPVKEHRADVHPVTNYTDINSLATGIIGLLESDLTDHLDQVLKELTCYWREKLLGGIVEAEQASLMGIMEDRESSDTDIIAAFKQRNEKAITSKEEEYLKAQGKLITGEGLCEWYNNAVMGFIWRFYEFNSEQKKSQFCNVTFNGSDINAEIVSCFKSGILDGGHRFMKIKLYTQLATSGQHFLFDIIIDSAWRQAFYIDYIKNTEITSAEDLKSHTPIFTFPRDVRDELSLVTGEGYTPGISSKVITDTTPNVFIGLLGDLSELALTAKETHTNPVNKQHCELISKTFNWWVNTDEVPARGGGITLLSNEIRLFKLVYPEIFSDWKPIDDDDDTLGDE